MIFGIGIDLIEVARVRKAIENNDSFLTKVFGSREIAKCQATNNKYQCYAARFAGKEAFMKALGSGWSKGIQWAEIEIINDDEGKPYLCLSGRAAEIAQELRIQRMNVSLTHVAEYASAVVSLETQDEMG